MTSRGPNISKSVGRAFALLELFAQEQRPLSATEVRNALSLPQPSARALLGELVELGFLSCDDTNRRYFPTGRLSRLTDWLSGRLMPDPRLTAAIDCIAARVGETASLSHRSGQYLAIAYACVADHPVAVRLRAGPGEQLWRSAAGRTLLAGLPSAECEALLAAFVRGQRRNREKDLLRRLPEMLSEIRRTGHYVAQDVLLRGVTTICVPVGYSGQRCVVTVAGATDRLAHRPRQVLRIIQRELRGLATA